jgi:hypothetical protein
MRRDLFIRAMRVGAAVALLGALSFQAAVAEKVPGARRSRRGLNLQALVFGVLETNRVFCGVNVKGELCVDPLNSPTVSGGFWPKGSVNSYIFNSGLQIAAVIPSDAGFEWAGDTTGVFFMDGRGDFGAGEQVELVYSSLDPDDALNWPRQGLVRDSAVFQDLLIDRISVSQQDIWTRYWDGNPVIAGGRTHPMGVLVEERGMVWNFPTGNEDIVYFTFDFTNITAKDRSVYSGLHPYIRDSIADIAEAYVAGVEDRFGITIPDGGYTFEDMYAAFYMDPDVGQAGSNYSTAILPYQMSMTYKSDFLEPDFVYTPEINGDPFSANPGFVGVKYLSSPLNPVTGLPVGLTMYANTRNPSGAGSGAEDPNGVTQMWRYLSGNNTPAIGDDPCTFPNPKERRLCFLLDFPTDIRFFQSSGPFRLEPGEQATIVVAYILAAPVAAALQGLVGGDVKPLFPYPGDSILAGTCGTQDCLRAVDSIAGWLSHNDDNGNGKIDQDEVVSVRRSLLDKALVAQAVFDNKFLLPFAPDPPPFFLVPGDNTVTVVWETTISEVTGDPFFQVANDPTSPLYDPNFRELDVEGYRIYRGRTTGSLQLIAQFDYAGTAITDATGGFDYGINCAPELGITTGCPTFPNDVPLAGEVIQVPPGGRVELADGSVFITTADTAVTGGASGFPPLAETGVPFAYIDNAVRNGFTYFYSVTAYDVNSVASGPTSLESGQVTQSVVPRSTASNKVAAGDVTFALIDRDGNVLDVAAPYPTIDPATGTFSGPMPPSGAASFELLAAELFADNLITPGSEAIIQVDSIQLAYYHDGTYFLSGTGTGAQAFAPGLPLGEEDGDAVMGPAEALLPADQDLADSLGLGEVPWAGKAAAQITAHAVTFQSRDADWHTSVDDAFFVATDPSMNSWGGSRWFDGDNETMADPANGIFKFGQLTGVNTIYQPTPCWSIVPGADDGCPGGSANALFRRNLQTTYHGTRAADVKVYWGAPGVVDSVIDVTHNLVVAFVPGTNIIAGWGFRNDIAGSSLTQAPADGLLDQYDFGHGPCFPGRPSWSSPNCASFPFLQTATLEPVDVDFDGAADGDGFAMYINGHFFIFQTAALPTNTVWTLRSYMGHVTKETGSYVFTPKPANPALPGLRLRITTGDGALFPDTMQVVLDSVHTVPDPYYVTTALETSVNEKLLQFVNLPSKAIIRIYSVSGILVDIIEHNDPTGGGTATWDLRNRNEQVVASGVYFYHIETATGQERISRFTVVQFSQ